MLQNLSRATHSYHVRLLLWTLLLQLLMVDGQIYIPQYFTHPVGHDGQT